MHLLAPRARRRAVLQTMLHAVRTSMAQASAGHCMVGATWSAMCERLA
jgi:hypothetical protein